MRLTCPQCQTEYEIPDIALSGRARTLRCDACGNKWKAPAAHSEPMRPLEEPVEPETLFGDEDETAVEHEPSFEEALMEIAAEEPEMAPQMAPEPEQPVKLSASRAAPAVPKPAPKKRGFGLVISVLIVVLAVGAVLTAHGFIGREWPPSLRLYDALGLH